MLDDIIAILLDKKKDMVTETDIFMWTPLHYAAQLGHLEATRKLLECDKSVAYLWDKEDSSALHVTAKKGYPDIMAEIIKRCHVLIIWLTIKVGPFFTLQPNVGSL